MKILIKGGRVVDPKNDFDNEPPKISKHTFYKTLSETVRRAPRSPSHDLHNLDFRGLIY